MKTDMFDAFVDKCRNDQAQLRNELRSYPPLGPMRVWVGPSDEDLQEITNDSIAKIKREIANIEATIEFVMELQKALDF